MLLLVIVVGLSTACDGYLEFTVQNESDETMGMGWFRDDCSAEVERKKRRGPLTDLVEPAAQAQIGGVLGGATSYKHICVVARSRDDTIVLLAPTFTAGRTC